MTADKQIDKLDKDDKEIARCRKRVERSVRSMVKQQNEAHRGRSNALFNLVLDIWTQFKQRGCISYLEESIPVRLPPRHPDRASPLASLATALQARFDQTDIIEDLEEVISLHRSALELRPPGHPKHALSLADLGNALRTRFKRTGDIQNLEEAILLHRSALDLRGPGHPDRAHSLVSLGVALQDRFHRTGDTGDLEEAISLLRSALELQPPGHHYHAHSLTNLGGALRDQFHRTGSIGDLEEAISLHRSALEFQPSGHPHRAYSLANLGVALRARLDRTGGNGDLEEAISLLRSVLDLLPPGHLYHSYSLTTLGDALVTRFQRTGSMGDLEQAILLHRSALEFRPPGHPDHAYSSASLGIALVTRFQRIRVIGDLEEAIVYFKSGTYHELSSFSDRLRAAHQWVTTARKEGHKTCLSAYSEAVTILEASLNHAPTLEMQHSLLIGKSGYASLAVDAASYAIEQADPCRAVEFLEQGMALQMCGLRVTVGDLTEVNKELASSSKVVSEKLKALTTEASPNGSQADIGLASDSRRLDAIMKEGRLFSKKRKEIIDKIRTLPGFEGFQGLTPFSKLQKAADEGPVIVLNHSRFRSDAIIVLHGRDPLVVSLSDDHPNIYKDLIKLHETLTNARSLSLTKLPGAYGKILRYVLETLWRLVVSKVVEKLKDIGVPAGSRIWWCPTSVLQSLPFHAAGEWRRNEHGVKKYHTHGYISSYTPTLGALIQARSSSKNPSAHPRSLLFVGEEDETLQSVGQEREVITLVEHCSRLIGSDATRDRVLESMKSHTWVHFACHGEVKPGKPFDACFKLSNGERLTLLDIVRARPPNAELAFLATCHTAEETGGSAHDEVLHLAACMQFCGFKSVIGMMWAMPDADAPDFAREFYKYMSAEDGMPEEGFKRSARALHRAAKKLRSRKEGRVPLESWVNFVHIGA